jgi:hypothetical protein
MEQSIISSQRTYLINHVQGLLAESEPHSVAFVLRILGSGYSSDIPYEKLLAALSGDVAYEGFPVVASLGYILGVRTPIPQAQTSSFIAGASRLTTRSESGLKALVADDVAILGIASGLALLKENEPEGVEGVQEWLLEIVNHPQRAKLWSYRMRDLAGDLLDSKGRLRVSVDEDSVDTAALELVLRHTWPQGFESVATPSENYSQLLQALVSIKPKEGDEVEKVAVWLKALDLVIQYLTAATLPDYDRTALSNLETVKEKLERKAVKKAKRRLWLSFIVLLLMYAAIAASIYYLTWNVMEQWIYILSWLPMVFVYGYLVATLREFTPLQIYSQLVEKYKQRLYEEFGFDLTTYEKAKSIASIERP